MLIPVAMQYSSERADLVVPIGSLVVRFAYRSEKLSPAIAGGATAIIASAAPATGLTLLPQFRFIMPPPALAMGQTGR